MNKNEEIGNRIAIVGMSIILVLCGFIFWIMQAYPPYIATVIRLENPHPCVYKDGEWAKVDKFRVDDNFYICSKVKSNKPDLRTQIQIRIYENEVSWTGNAVHYQNQWIEAGDQQIRLNTYLDEGSYVVQVNTGKETISVIDFKVMEQ